MCDLCDCQGFESIDLNICSGAKFIEFFINLTELECRKYQVYQAIGCNRTGLLVNIG